jgi:hypothetical protein
MTNPILYQGGRSDSIFVVNGIPRDQTTFAGQPVMNTTYADAATEVDVTTDIFQCPFLDASNNATTINSGTLYVHFDMYVILGSFAAANLVEWRDGSGFPWLALRGVVSTKSIGLYYNSNTGASPTWTQLGTGVFTVASGHLYTFDVALTFGSLAAAVSVNGSAVPNMSGTFTQPSFGAITLLQFAGTGNSTQEYFSQILAMKDQPTIGAFVHYGRATGAGANSGWAGAYTDVNEPINNDGTVNTASVAALRQTYPVTAVTVAAGYYIGGVWQWLRGRDDAIAPNNIQSSIRNMSNNTNYDYGANMPGIGTSFIALPARYDVDPATGVAWIQTDRNLTQFGFLSVT